MNNDIFLSNDEQFESVIYSLIETTENDLFVDDAIEVSDPDDVLDFDLF